MCKDNNSQDYYYVVVRSDIPLADQLCQVSHASTQAGRLYGIHEHCNVVVLDVDSKEKLLKVIEKLKVLGIQHMVQIECDDDMGETCLATEMLQGSMRNIFRQYSLWKAPIAQVA